VNGLIEEYLAAFGFRPAVTVPVHPEFAESPRAARAAGIIGAEGR